MPAEERVAAQQKLQKAKAAYEDIKTRIGAINPNRLTPIYYLGRISRLFQSDLI